MYSDCSQYKISVCVNATMTQNYDSRLIGDCIFRDTTNKAERDRVYIIGEQKRRPSPGLSSYFQFGSISKNQARIMCTPGRIIMRGIYTGVGRTVEYYCRFGNTCDFRDLLWCTL